MIAIARVVVAAVAATVIVIRAAAVAVRFDSWVMFSKHFVCAEKMRDYACLQVEVTVVTAATITTVAAVAAMVEVMVCLLHTT
jgi:hypothetical protein